VAKLDPPHSFKLELSTNDPAIVPLMRQALYGPDVDAFVDLGRMIFTSAGEKSLRLTILEETPGVIAD
jgi:hypothetical protein